MDQSASHAFDRIKSKMTKAPVLRLPDFDNIFELACDASNVDIGGVLSQESQLVAFFNEKFSNAKCKYSPYELKFYIVIRALQH